MTATKEARMRKFAAGVAEKLDHYVYLLIDPRNGQPFYVGKGQGDRVFDHINAEISHKTEEDDELPARRATIRAIRNANLEVVHVILRHDMNDRMAKEVESAFIDYLPGLTNLASGIRSDYGPANADELEYRYGKPTMDPAPDHKLLYIKTRRDVIEAKGCLYEAVRASWVVKRERAEKAQYVLAVVNGVCEGVFAECKWEEWGDGRYGFEGRQLDRSDPVAARYVDKLIPDDKRRRGAANPVQYGYD